MKYYFDLYLSDEYKGKQKSLIRKLERKESPIDQYLIVLAQDGENHLEIFNSVFLRQNIYDIEKLFVVGIAEGLFDAYAIVENITQEVYNETGDADIKGYIVRKQREYEER